MSCYFLQILSFDFYGLNWSQRTHLHDFRNVFSLSALIMLSFSRNSLTNLLKTSWLITLDGSEGNLLFLFLCFAFDFIGYGKSSIAYEISLFWLLSTLCVSRKISHNNVFFPLTLRILF